MATLSSLLGSNFVGDIGPAGEITIGTVVAGSNTTNAVVTNVGTSTSAILNFTVPIGPQGPAGSGGVTGPVGATDNAIARFNGTGGVTLQNGVATIDDSGNITATSFLGDGSSLTGIVAVIAQVRNSATITNLNGTASFTDVAITGISDQMDTGFTAGATGITCSFTGRIKVTVHITSNSATGARVAPIVRAAVGGVGSPIEGATGYIRNLDGHFTTTCTATCFLSVTSGDVVTLQTKQGSTVLDVTTGVAGGCMILIERM